MGLIQLIIKNSYCHENLTLDFASGINYITGANESGKSEALSMIPYALFGSVGLRDKIDAYKELEVTLKFKVNTTIYTVFRSNKVINLIDANTTIATGTTAVNKAIINLFSYDFEIFNKTNYSQQSDAEMYNKMTKSEMTKFVEKASGVENAKEQEKALDSRRKELNTLIKSLKPNLIVTDVSFSPNREMEELLLDPGYLDSIKDQTTQIYTDIKALTSRIATAKAKQNTPVFSDGSIEAASALLDSWTETLSKYDLKALKRSYNERESAIQELEREEKNFNKLEDEFNLSLDWYLEQQKQLETNKLVAEKEGLLAKGSITCPSCYNSFPLMHDSLSKFEGLESNSVSMSESKLNSAISWKTYKSLEASTSISDLKSKISGLFLDCENFLEFSKLKEQQVNMSYKISNYYEDLERYEANNSSILKALGGQTLEELEESVKDAEERFERLNKTKEDLTYYSQAKAVFEVRQEFITKSKEEIEIYSKELLVVEKALELSRQIKLNLQQRFIPTLNRKASTLVQQITDGKRYKLEITDDFMLTMDTHNIKVFSGSAKVVANIAFRLAYVETFFKKNFPVFIGDEIDSFFDADRAKELHTVFKSLEAQDYQIILISHFTQSDGHILDITKIKADMND